MEETCVSTIVGQEHPEEARGGPEELLSRLRAAIAKPRVAADVGAATGDWTLVSSAVLGDPPQAESAARRRGPAFPDCWPGDIDILARVLEALYSDLAITGKYLRVTVERGELTISGEVARSYQKSCAEADVRRVAGVKSVTNEIEVKPTGRRDTGPASPKPWR
jgi:BON domain